MTKICDYSTRKLKRIYVRSLRGTWRWEPYRMDGIARDIGYSGEYWRHRDAVGAVKRELVSRGVYLP